MVNIHTFWCRGCQQLLILVPWGVQIVNVNLKDTFDGKTTLIWCRGVPWVSRGAVGCDCGVIWLIYINFGAVGCQQLLILVPWGVQIVNVNLKDTFDGKTTLIWCLGVPWVSWGVVESYGKYIYIHFGAVGCH